LACWPIVGRSTTVAASCAPVLMLTAVSATVMVSNAFEKVFISLLLLMTLIFAKCRFLMVIYPYITF
jgi:hypothetical protein